MELVIGYITLTALLFTLYQSNATLRYYAGCGYDPTYP